jgi:hypothetical protein
MMNRAIFVCALLVAAAATLAAQDASQANTQQSPYAGVSHPPADDVIETSSIPEPKPPAGKPLNATPAQAPAPQPQVSYQQAAPPPAPMAMRNQPPAASGDLWANSPAPQPEDGTDAGIVGIAHSYPPPAPPELNARAYAGDPDSDVVHPHARPGELQEGTNIRVHLLDRLSTVDSQKGEPFRTRVATDVLQGGQVMIPAGSEIDGRVVSVSTGQFAGHGTMRLEPQSVILPDGTRFNLHADVTATPGSRTRVVGEGTIRSDSRAKRDGIEYGGAVGAGLITGAIIAGPGGALAGGIIGAGAVTVHLLVSHPQATLETGTTLIFQLTDPLYLSPEVANGN